MRYELVIFDFNDTIGHLTVRWSDVKRELVEWAKANDGKIDPADHIIVIANELSMRPDGKKKVVELFDRYESECVGKKTYLLFPSMVGLMKDLKKAGYRLAIATGNEVGTVSSILEIGGLDGLVECISGIDTVRISKPDPETLDNIVTKLGVDKKRALFIGNSDFDVLCGKNAGIETIKIRTLWEDDVSMLREMLL